MSPPDDFTRPWGERLRTWRENVMHWSRGEFVQHVISAAYRTNEARGHELSESLVKKWEGGGVRNPQGVYQRILASMGAPLPMPVHDSDPPLPSQLDQKSSNDEGVDRRDFLQHAGSAAALTVGSAQLGDALQRLERTLAGDAKVDDGTVADLQRQTQDLFDAEERFSSGRVLDDAAKHLSTLTTLISGTQGQPFAHQLTLQAGTTAALVGWLAFDQGAFDTAHSYYRTAEGIAANANDPLLLACVRTYRSYLADARGQPKESAQWLDEAQAVLPRGQQATMHMWIAARQAEVAISLGESATALRSLERAYLVQDFGHVDERPAPWTKFFTPTRLDGMAVAGYARLNHDDMHPVADRLLTSAGTGETKVEQIALADLAYSYLERGDVERGAELAQRAVSAIAHSRTRVGYERLDVVTRALAPYRNSKATTDLRQQLATVRNADS